jgi:hypothetical protein
MRCGGASAGGVLARKPPELAEIWRDQEISERESFAASECFPVRPAKDFLGSGCLEEGALQAFRSVVENQDAAVTEWDLLGLP